MISEFCVKCFREVRISGDREFKEERPSLLFTEDDVSLPDIPGFQEVVKVGKRGCDHKWKRKETKYMINKRPLVTGQVQDKIIKVKDNKKQR